MKTIPARSGVFCLAMCFLSAPVSAGNATNSPPKVTYDLRDGSRVVGQSGDEFFRFHSELLGDLKLAVAELRSVDCTGTNIAKITATNGDTFTVSFAASELAAKTSFGKIKLAVAAIRKITVLPADGGNSARLPGLVALWSGEDNGRDSVGTNDAELTDMQFADGKVGRAFSLNGNSMVKISPNFAGLAAGSGFTLGAWIKPSDVSKNSPIFEWVQEGISPGTQFYIYPPDGGPGTLYALIGDVAGGAHYFYSTPAVVVADEFQYVTLTYDKASGLAKIYCNGVIVAQQHLGNFTPQTSCDLYLGKRPLIGGETYAFSGLLDQAAIYDRALSESEIRKICTEDNHGEPLRQPLRTTRNLPYRNGF